MSDRVRGCTVVFAEDISEEEAQAVADSILLLRGVFQVGIYLVDPSDFMAKSRVRHELRKKLFDALENG